MLAVIQFSTDGTGKAVYTEALPLGEIGCLTMKRASVVDFNETSQEWEVRFCDEPDRVQYSNPSRSNCISWEVATLNERLLMK